MMGGLSAQWGFGQWKGKGGVVVGLGVGDERWG